MHNPILMNKTKLSLLFISLLALLVATCTGEEKTSVENNPLAAGKKLLLDNCAACHNLPANNPTGIAPSFLAIKAAYKADSKEEFTKEMIDFLNAPSSEKSKMPESVDQYGLMPKMGFPEEDLLLITNYLYQTNLEKDEISTQDLVKNDQELDYLEEGRKIALQTKSILGKNLMYQVKTNGPEAAVGFCNEKAIFLTDSMSIALNAQVKRVTNKPRNLINQANKVELGILDELLLKENKKGILRETTGKKLGYFAIETNEMCLKCHGDLGTEINSKTAEKVSELYPNDKAINYKANELRGMWVVEMDAK